LTITAPVSKPASRILLTIWIILMQIFALASLVIWLLFVFISLVFHDDPGPYKLSTLIFLTLFYSYPIYPLGTMTVAWATYIYRRDWLAWIFSGLQIFPILYIVYEFVRAS